MRLPAPVRALLLGLALLAAASNAALAQGGGAPAFDHNTTLFPLVGAHARVPCEDCHKSGLPAKGLPRTCNACHVQGGMRASTFKPPLHIPTSLAQQCSDCHNQNAWTPAVMLHTSDMFGQCARCHNNSQAKGKPPAHLPTTASCDACHTTGAWTPTKRVMHDASTVGRCSSCHNGTIASGKTPFHVPTTAQCDTCHTSTVTWLNALYTHDELGPLLELPQLQHRARQGREPHPDQLAVRHLPYERDHVHRGDDEPHRAERPVLELP
jgi:hypothetical protein